GDQFIGGGRGNPGTYTKGLKLNSDFLSWGAALSYKPVENGNFYLSFSDANEPPGANLAFSGGDTDRLDPQDADSYELGTKWELFNNNLLVSAAYFNTERSVLD